MSDDQKDIPSRGFAKLDSGIVDSTLWMKPHDALRVWIALLAKSDSYGIVRIAAPALAHQCFLTPERLAEIMADFCSPDPDSRTPEHDGRRLQAIEGGWMILNYLRYRDMMQRKAASHAERQAKYREKVRVRDGRVTHRVTSDTEADSRGREQKSRSRSKTPLPPKGVTEAEFALLWQACKRKIGPDKALAKYAQLRRDGIIPPVDEVIRALESLQASDDWAKDGRKFQPHLTTWLNRGGWKEEPREAGQSQGATSGTPSAYGIDDETRARLAERHRKAVEESRRDLEKPDQQVPR